MHNFISLVVYVLRERGEGFSCFSCDCNVAIYSHNLTGISMYRGLLSTPTYINSINVFISIQSFSHCGHFQ